MIKKPIIAVDIDEVLSPFVLGLVDWHNRQYGTNYQFNDFNTYEFHKVWGGGIDEAIKKCCEHFETRGAIQPIANALTVLTKLRENYDLIVVTSRMLQHKPQTYAWVNDYLPNLFQEIILCNHWDKEQKQPSMSKSTACRQLGAQYLIDDCIPYAMDAASAGITCLLFGAYPWNQQHLSHDAIHRVKDWVSVDQYFAQL